MTNDILHNTQVIHMRLFVEIAAVAESTGTMHGAHFIRLQHMNFSTPLSTHKINLCAEMAVPSTLALTLNAQEPS